MKISVIFFLFTIATAFAQAEDWTIKDKTYHNVIVEKSDAAYVSIMYDGGVGRIALADLPPDLQKRFNYVPALALKTAQAEEAARAQAIIQAQIEAQAEKKADAAAQIKAQAEESAEDQASNALAQKQSADEQLKTIWARVGVLESDISEKDRLVREEWAHHGTQGAYAGIIADDKKELEKLKAQIAILSPGMERYVNSY